MGTAAAYPPAQLVIPALLAAEASDGHERYERLRAEVHRALEEEFGAVDVWGGAFPFIYTDYYRSEMGAPLTRVFFVAEESISPDSLADCKEATNRIEARFIHGGGRRVNLDPGLMLPGRFLLASTKDAAHRVPLRDGIYAELTLLFRKGDFRPLDWTYPDYRSEEYRAVLRKIRAAYVTRLRDS